MAANWWDSAPVVQSGIDGALQAEGVSGPKADFVKSIYQQESSSGSNTKTSNAGATGGMQIIPATFDRMADKGWSINNPEQNMRAGVRYASLVYDKAGGDPALAGAGYYGGEGAINKARAGVAVSDPRNPNAPNTLQYGQQVASRMPPTDGGNWWANAPVITAPAQQPAATTPAALTPPSKQPPIQSIGDYASRAVQRTGDLAAGLVRGAGSIGTTLMGATVDPLARATGLDQTDVGQTLGLGKTMAERRQGMDNALQSMGANTSSGGYAVGKLGGEIAGTAGVGGALASGARLAGAAPALVNALASSGMSTGATVAQGAIPAAANMLARMAGGAAAGGASAALVNPSSASTGAAIGAILPPALAGIGFGANALSKLISGPGMSQAVADGATAARGAGLVVPPTQVNPSLANRLMEGTAGKLTTAQNASAKNAPVLNDMVATELGLQKGAQITPDILSGIRKQAGQAYDAVGSTGTITPGPSYEQALDKITASARQAAAGFPNAKPNLLIAEVESLKSPEFDASSAISKISDLRESADVAYRAGNKQLGAGLKSAAGALEDAIDSHLTQIGAPADLLTGFRDARQLIAKTYSVEKALNATTGMVNAQNLAGQLAKGKPLSGGILDAAQFAQQFPKAAQPLEKMGSLPGVSPLDLYGAAATGGLTAVLPASRMAARSLALSPLVQNRLVSAGQPNRLANLMNNSDANQLFYRASPQAANR